MELINLERVLPEELKQKIRYEASKVAGDEEFNVVMGQVFIGKHPLNKDVTTDMVINLVCEFFKAPKSIVLSKTRKQPYTQYRQTICYMLRKYTDLTFGEIGYKLGGLSHATILHANNAINNYILTDPRFREKLDHLDEKIQRLLSRESLNEKA